MKTDNILYKGAASRSKAIYAWELGSGFGHVELFAPLGHALEALDCKIEAFVQNTEPALRANLSSSSAPKRLVLPSLVETGSHSSILKWNGGYFDHSNLQALTANWLSVFEYSRPDFVICDFAPGAMLAAKICNIHRVVFDTGFFTPPFDHPFPHLAFEEPESIDSLRESEAEVLAIANQILKEFGAAELDEFKELFNADDTYFGHHAALDVFQRDDRSAFVGPFVSMPQCDQKEIVPGALKAFAYLNAQMPASLPSLKCLVDNGVEVIAYIANSAKYDKVLNEFRNLTVLDRPAEMDKILPIVDFVLCHGGVGTINRALSCGKPLLIAPNFFEQVQNATSLENLGLGRFISPRHNRMAQVVIPEFLSNILGHVDACADFHINNAPGCPDDVAKKILENIAVRSKSGSPPSDAFVWPENTSAFVNVRRSILFGDLGVIFAHANSDSDQEDFLRIIDLAPHAKSISKESLLESYDCIADCVPSDRFIIIEPGRIVSPEFFEIETAIPPSISNSTWSWSNLQDSNGLCYNTGGVEVWTKAMFINLLNHKNSTQDKYYLFSDHAGYSQFGKTFSKSTAYRSSKEAYFSGFEEVMRLGRNANGIPRDCKNITKYMHSLNVRRLAIWMNVGADTEFGLWAILGARIAFTILGRGLERMGDELCCEFKLASWLEEREVCENTECLKSRVKAAGDEIRSKFGLTLVEEWSSEISKSFKIKMARLRPNFGIFDMNEELV